MIQGSGYENEFSDLQLSDSDSDDDNWNNEALDDTIKNFQMLSLTINNFFIFFLYRILNKSRDSAPNFIALLNHLQNFETKHFFGNLAVGAVNGGYRLPAPYKK